MYHNNNKDWRDHKEWDEIEKKNCFPVGPECLESFQSTLKLQVIVTLQIGTNNKMELSAQTRSMTVRLLHFQMKFGIILVPAFISIIVKHQTRIICTNWPTPPQYNDGANHPFQMKSVEIKCDFICIMKANKEKAYILENKAMSLMKSVVFL